MAGPPLEDFLSHGWFGPASLVQIVLLIFIGLELYVLLRRKSPVSLAERLEEEVAARDLLQNLAGSPEEATVTLPVGGPGPEDDVKFTFKGRCAKLTAGLFLLALGIGYVLGRAM